MSPNGKGPLTPQAAFLQQRPWARKIRSAIKGSGAVSAVMSFMDDIAKIIKQIGPLGTKLRQSIRFVVDDVIDTKRRMFRPSAHYKSRLDELASAHPGAHGPQKHGWGVSMRTLRDRILEKCDPVTGATLRRAPSSSTKFNSAADQVRAFDYLTSNWGTLGNQAGAALREGKDYVYIDVDIVDIFGPKANARFSGYARVGSAVNPTGVTPVDFTGGKIRTGFKLMENPATKMVEAVYDSSFPMGQ